MCARDPETNKKEIMKAIETRSALLRNCSLAQNAANTKEQGQVPRAATKSSAGPAKPHPSKAVTLQIANQWVESIEKGTTSEDELSRQEPALRCFVKYLRKISYSDKYNDETHEYRHVTLPRQQASDLYKVYKDRVSISPLLEKLFKGELLEEADWREIGVQQSLGWVHYCNHRPEPHILLFRRPLPQPMPQPTPTSELSSKMGRMLSFN